MSDNITKAGEHWNKVTAELIAIDEKVQRGEVSQAEMMLSLYAIVGWLTAAVGTLIINEQQEEEQGEQSA